MCLTGSGRASSPLSYRSALYTGLHFARGRTGRSSRVDQLLKRLFHRCNPIIDRSYFCLAQWYLLAELHQVRFALQQLHLRGMFGQIVAQESFSRRSGGVSLADSFPDSLPVPDLFSCPFLIPTVPPVRAVVVIRLGVFWGLGWGLFGGLLCGIEGSRKLAVAAHGVEGMIAQAVHQPE